MRWGSLPILLVVPSVLLANGRIAYIEFFGYQGIDVPAVRRALTFREGDAVAPDIADRARSAVKSVTGLDATDVEEVCCAGAGDPVIFIGLPGTSSHPLTFEKAPQDVANAPAELKRLYDEMMRVEIEDAGKSRSQEDGAAGYRLSMEPAARAAELALRAYVLSHEDEVFRVASSGDALERAMAIDALGFGARTPRQIAALARAIRDPEPAVRNNATRALLEILRADPSVASQVPVDNFIQMLRSTEWTDRNKSSAMLMFLAQSRDPQLFARLQSEAGDSLHEMANWPNGWSIPARVILGRIAGIPWLPAFVLAYFEGLPLSLLQGAALAALVSALFTLLFVRLTSKATWALALLTPAALSALLYWVLLRISGRHSSEYGVLALVFILAWYLAAAAASCAIVLARTRLHFHPR